MTYRNISEKQNRFTDIENRLVVARGRGFGGGKIGSLRLGDKLLCVGWVNNKVLLYSRGNCIQYPVINHNGKRI